MFSCGQNKQEKLVTLWETITKGYVFLLKILTAKARVVLWKNIQQNLMLPWGTKNSLMSPITGSITNKILKMYKYYLM